jgi:hypothetical protein
VIPEAAVEAAAKLIVRTVVDRSWDSLLPSRQEWYRDQARAALEAAAPHMLAKVSTLMELDALPRFTVIRSSEGAVFERNTMWHEAGSRDLKYSPDIALPVTVLQLGWGQP